jgi:predicted RNase H-like HicB family nuclease
MSDDIMPGKGSYTALYTRERDGSWTAQVQGHENEIHAFGRSLHKARTMLREVLELWYDDAATAHIEDRIVISPELLAEIQELSTMSRDAEELLEALGVRRKKAVLTLKRKGFGTRDIADLLGLSQQRISQIARGTR